MITFTNCIKECFYLAFETEVHYTISQAKLFQPGDFVAIGASGGKDSTVLAYIMKTLNDRLEGVICVYVDFLINLIISGITMV